MTLRAIAVLTAISTALLLAAAVLAIAPRSADSATIAADAIVDTGAGAAAAALAEAGPDVGEGDGSPARLGDAAVAEPSSPALLVVPVEPPALVELPADLYSTPTPEADPIASLPMLTTIAAQPRAGGVVYLTFDDGPSPTTGQILDLLSAHGAKATFFVLGSSVERHPDIVRRIAAEGHAIGNHAWAHEALPNESDDHIRQTLGATSSAVHAIVGRATTCVRPPYGALDQRSHDIVSAEGYSVSMWEVDSNDWKHRDPAVIAADVLTHISLGDRVLFHDGPNQRPATVAAVGSVLEILSAQGVTFAALPC